MPIQERLELVGRAEKEHFLIIEDDYNSEFKYFQKPVPSLQGLSGGRNVIYLGTFSKMLLPSIRISYMILPPELMESELFGYETGAFTGAKVGGVKGKFEMADTGTIFLDEIGELPLPMQAKLLRVLETGEIQKIAHKGQLHSDFRLIGATNKNLAEMVRQGQFREDLYHRLSVFELDIPPLRDRVSDIPLLVRHFVTQSVGDNRQKDIRIDDALYDAFAQYPWRGNVRELKNVLVYALYSLGDDQSVLTVQHLPPRFMRELEASVVAGTIPDTEDSHQDSQNFSEASARAERKVLWEALVNSRYNKVLAARTLGISRSKLYRKLREHGLLAKFEAQ